MNLYFESAGMILTLITLGKFLETRAKGKTGDAIRQLMDLAPKTATVLRDGAGGGDPRGGGPGGRHSGGAGRAGRIPVDGAVLEGRAAVDQSALTGESRPRGKGPRRHGGRRHSKHRRLPELSRRTGWERTPPWPR